MPGGAVIPTPVPVFTTGPTQTTHNPVPCVAIVVTLPPPPPPLPKVEADRGEDLGAVHCSLPLSEYLNALHEEKLAKAAKIAENGGGGGVAGEGSESKKKRAKSKKAEVSAGHHQRRQRGGSVLCVGRRGGQGGQAVGRKRNPGDDKTEKLFFGYRILVRLFKL